MSVEKMESIGKRIEEIKEALSGIGPMRPGSLTCQYKDPKSQSGPYWQISYTRAMRSRSEYVRQECVAGIREEIAVYKQFKQLVDEWIDLSIELSKLKMKMKKSQDSK